MDQRAFSTTILPLRINDFDAAVHVLIGSDAPTATISLGRHIIAQVLFLRCLSGRLRRRES